MRNRLMVVLIVGVFYATTGFATVKKNKIVTLNFTMTYKQDAEEKPIEHVMKNTYVLTNNKWITAGKYNSGDDRKTILLLARMLSHKNNKFNLQFMLIDSSDDHTFVAQPQMNVISGLPAQLKRREGDKSIQLDVLVNMSPQPKN